MNRRRVLLADALEVLIDHRGKTPKKLGGEWTTEGHRVVSALNIKGSRVDANDHHYISSAMYARWMKVPLRAGDVLLTSEAPTGEVAFLEERRDWALGQRLFGLRGKPGVLHGRYLYYALRDGDARHQMMSRATGTTVSGLRQSELVRIELALPPIDEQRAIAATLGALDDLIESNRCARRTADDLGDALWKSLANRTTDRVSIDRLISSGAVRLSDGYRTRSDELGEPGVPILRVADMVDEHYALAPDGEMIHDNLSTKYSEKVALPGDACVTTKGTVGRTALIRPDDPQAVYSPQLCFLRATARAPLPPSALYRWLRSPSFTSQALTVQHQTDMAAYVSLADFRRFTIPLVDPLADELREIEALDDVVTSKRREVAALTRLRDALLPELLSGRIRVPEATCVVQDVIDESEND